MTNQFRKKSICLLLIISMFFLGMCYGNTQAESSLMYGIIHHTDSVFSDSLVTEGENSFLSEASAASILANAMLRQEVKRLSSRTVRELTCLFLTVELLSQIIPVIFAREGVLTKQPAKSNDVIIRYIHRTDGKKNN